MLDAKHNNAGLVQGTAAYTIWGLFPIYWFWLKHIPALEVMAHRVIWCFVLLLIAGICMGNIRDTLKKAKNLKILALLTLTACIISINWLVYIWAISHEHAIETSLGYFISPLISIVFGAVFLKERLRLYQHCAVLLATIGVCILTFVHGSLPWVALTLAVSFGSYSLLRKLVTIDSQSALFIETTIIFLPALLYIMYGQHSNVLYEGSLSTIVLLIAGGGVTIIPLILLANSLKALTLSTVGFLQYISPTMQFFCALLFFKEPLVTSQVWCFVFIWLGLIIFTAEAIVHKKMDNYKVSQGC